MEKLLAGLAFLGWGTWCLVAVALGKRSQMMFMPDAEWVRTLLGEHYDRVMNFVFGLILVMFGSLVFID